MNKLDEIRARSVLYPYEAPHDIDFLLRAVEQLSVEHKALMKLKEKLGKNGDYSMVREDDEPMDIFEVISIRKIFEKIEYALDPDIKEMVESE